MPTSLGLITLCLNAAAAVNLLKLLVSTFFFFFFLSAIERLLVEPRFAYLNLIPRYLVS